MATKAHKQMVVVLGIIEHEDKFLMLQRVDTNPMWHHKWELPGGGVDPGETTLETLFRECQEETGLEVTQPTLLGIYNHDWELPDHIQQTFLVIYRCLAPHKNVVLSEENNAFVWTTPESYLEIGQMLGPNQKLMEELYFPSRAKQYA